MRARLWGRLSLVASVLAWRTLPGGRCPADPLRQGSARVRHIAPAAGYAGRAGGRTVGDMRPGVVAVLLAAGVLPVAACTGNGLPSAGAGPTVRASAAHAGAVRAGAPASNGCAGQPLVSPLPVWARAGFSPADQAMPHVLGEAGNIVAILWARRDALHSPPLHDRNNKILWVSRLPLTRAGSAGHQGHARGQRAHGDQVRARRARAVDHRSADVRLLDIPSALARPHRRTQAALRGLTEASAGTEEAGRAAGQPNGWRAHQS